MKTRTSNYTTLTSGITFDIRAHPRKRLSHCVTSELSRRSSKSRRMTKTEDTAFCGFDHIPEDLMISIFVAVSSSADNPCDLVNTMLTCRKFCAVATNPKVLANASRSALAVKAHKWSDGAHQFLKQCANAGNIEACYILGMILFYCLRNRGGGASLMAQAAMASHASALYSLAVIKLNGSGRTRKDKDPKGGVSLCARAAALGHVDAIRELGHCVQDGYGVTRNTMEGRRLLIEANVREAAAASAPSPKTSSNTHASKKPETCTCLRCLHRQLYHQQDLNKSNSIACSRVNQQHVQHTVHQYRQAFRISRETGCSLLSDFGVNIAPSELHAGNRFLVDWFTINGPPTGLRLCSHANCGRPETRKHEFRRCSACGSVNYCSRACQALDWKIRHKHACTARADWEAPGRNTSQITEQDINEI